MEQAARSARVALGWLPLLALSACSSTSNDFADVTRSEHGGPAGADAVDGAVEADEDARVMPRDLRVMALAGGNGALELAALTLQRGPDGPELFAALRNQGAVPACSAAFAFELFDRAQRSVAAGIGGLLTREFYRLTDGTGAIAACLGPGQVSMVAVTDLPADLELEAVGTVVYRCPYFALDVTPIDGLRIDRVQRQLDRTGTAFSGTLVNGLDVTLQNPSVSVFSLNRAGRPLAVASATGQLSIPPAGTWPFETVPSSEAGSDWMAYPAGELVQGAQARHAP